MPGHTVGGQVDQSDTVLEVCSSPFPPSLTAARYSVFN